LIGERNEHYDLGDLTLARVEGVTDEVIVTAQRQVLEANLDRRVFDLSADLARTTGSVLDAMRGLPGVTVTQEGQIQLRGSDRVAILIDGKQSGLTGIGNQAGLDSIPAGSIASIEVINNPSAAYDANGMAGVINIVYRQDQAEGLQLDSGLSLGVGALDKRKPDLPTELGSFSSNWKVNRASISSTTLIAAATSQADVLFQEDLPNNEFTTRYYDDGRVTLSQVPENREQEQVVMRGGFDREIDDYRSWTFSSLFDSSTTPTSRKCRTSDALAQEVYRFFCGGGEDGAPESRAHAHASSSSPEKELTGLAVHARLGGRGVFSQRPFGAAQRERDPPRCARAHAAVPARLREAAAQRPNGNGLQATAARDTRRLRRQPRRGHGHLSRSWRLVGVGREDLRRLRQLRARAAEVCRRGRLPRRANGRAVRPTAREHLLQPERRIRLFRAACRTFASRTTFGTSDRIAVYYNNRVDRPSDELRIFPKYDDPEILKVGNLPAPAVHGRYELAYERLWERGNAIVSLYRLHR
jgi:hypothetical protein